MSVETVLVHTKNGPVRGRKRNGTPEYVSFQGIPFAKPPVGELRFKAPVPIDNWTEPIDALQAPAVAYANLDVESFQLDPRSSEDCLYLNVYTKDVSPTTLRPVMLYIHGGGFMIGSTDEAMYSPDFLLRDDIVFVTVAYRLGALGFLSVPDPAIGIPGNAGLKDQALAMRWVRDNIAAFGGDPENVTLFGHSAGAGSVHYHMLSEYSRDLFHRAIVQSGNAMTVCAQQPRWDLNQVLARKLGWSGEGGVEGMMQVLRDAAPADIVKHQHLGERADQQRGHYFVYVPTVEPYGADTAECFLPRAPELLAERAWGNAIPMLIGCTTDECMMFYKEWKRNADMFEDSGTFTNLLPFDVVDTFGPKELESLSNKLVQHYYGNERPSHENLPTFSSMVSDKIFWHGAAKAIRARERKADSAPTFLYRFSFDSQQPAFDAVKLMFCGQKVRGAIHVEELMYLFKFAFVDYDLPEGSAELKLIDTMVSIWTTFAASGDPNHSKLGQQWEPTRESTGFKCLDLNEKLSFVELPEIARVAIWDEMDRKAK